MRQYVPPVDQRVLWISEGGRLRGLAPLYVQHLTVAGLPVARRMSLAGGGRTTPLELPQVLSAPGQGRAVIRALVQSTLSDDVSWSEISLTREQGWFTQGTPGGQGRQLTFERHQQARACVVLALADTWEQTRAGLKRNVKESLRRGRNRMAKDGRSWQIRHRTGTDLGPAAVDRLLALHAARSQYSGSWSHHHDAFADTSIRTFMQRLLPELGAAGQASIVELELDAQVVAAQLVLHAPGTIYFHSSGFLPQVWELSPVTTLQGSAIVAAIARGDRWVNFSPGPNESKLRWSESLHVLDDFAYGAGGRAALGRYTAFFFAKDIRQLRHVRHEAARETTRQN